MPKKKTDAVCVQAQPAPTEPDLGSLPRISPGPNRKLGTIVDVGVSDGRGGVYLVPHLVAPLPNAGPACNDPDEIERSRLEADRKKPDCPRIPIQMIEGGERYNQDIRFHRIDVLKLKEILEAMRPKPAPPAWVIRKPKWWLGIAKSRFGKMLSKMKQRFSRKKQPAVVVRHFTEGFERTLA